MKGKSHAQEDLPVDLKLPTAEYRRPLIEVLSALLQIGYWLTNDITLMGVFS